MLLMQEKNTLLKNKSQHISDKINKKRYMLNNFGVNIIPSFMKIYKTLNKQKNYFNNNSLLRWTHYKKKKYKRK